MDGILFVLLIRLCLCPPVVIDPFFKSNTTRKIKEHQVMNPAYDHDKALDHGHIGQDNTSGVEQSNGTQRNARI